MIGGAFTLLVARVYGRTHGGTMCSTKFGRPERVALLIAGILSPAPFNTVLFVAAALCCVISAAQILALGPGPQCKNRTNQKRFK